MDIEKLQGELETLNLEIAAALMTKDVQYNSAVRRRFSDLFHEFHSNEENQSKPSDEEQRLASRLTADQHMAWQMRRTIWESQAILKSDLTPAAKTKALEAVSQKVQNIERPKEGRLAAFLDKLKTFFSSSYRESKMKRQGAFQGYKDTLQALKPESTDGAVSSKSQGPKQ